MSHYSFLSASTFHHMATVNSVKKSILNIFPNNVGAHKKNIVKEINLFIENYLDNKN